MVNDNSNGQYYYNRGIVKSRLDLVKEAIDDYSKAIELTSEQDHLYQARFNKGICLRRLGPDYLDKSIEDLKKAAEMKNDRPSVHNNLGLSYFEKGDFEEALIHYGKAIQYEKSSVHYNNRGLANYHVNCLKEAKADFDRAIELDSNDHTIYFNRGNVYLNWEPQQEFDLAHRDYERAIELAPNNAKLWHAKGLAFQGQAE